MNFANNLRFLRRSRGYSQEFISERLGYKSFTTVQKWESGVSEPSVEKLKKLADLFDVSMDELLNADFEGNNSGASEEDNEILDRERKLLLICRKLREANQDKLYEYASLLLRDEQQE